MKLERTFLALVSAQALHSVEEYFGRLWEVFPPARFISGVISPDLERGFVIFNVTFVLFGFWCYLWPVRRGWGIARALVWLWVGVEMMNGIGHPVWALSAGAYRPGLITSLPLLVLAVSLATQLRSRVEAGRATG